MTRRQLTLDVDPVFYAVGIYVVIKGGTQPGVKGGYAFLNGVDELVPCIEDAALYATREAAERNCGLFDVFEFDPKRHAQCHDCRAIMIQHWLTMAIDLAGVARAYCPTCRRKMLESATRWQDRRSGRRAT